MSADNHTPEVPQKRCSKGDNCLHPDGPELPATLEYFYPVRSGKYISRDCRTCHRKQMRTYLKPEKERERHVKYRANNKSKIAASSRLYRAQNRERRKAYNNAWNRNNRERLHRREKTYRKRRPEVRRAIKAKRRIAESAVSPKDIRQLYVSQKGLCWWCEKPVGDDYHIDHRIPLARGGSGDLPNLCVSCPTCNLSKGAKLPHEWNGRLF